MQLAPNTLALIALCNEYCAVVQTPPEPTADELELEMEPWRPLVRQMLRLLPRIYISATTALEARAEALPENDGYIDNALDEDHYDAIRRGLENLLGPEDTYLEAFHQDMKYSDTPIAASISEGLSDLFQVFFNFIETVREAIDEVTNGALDALLDDFQSYWSATLCNVLRALNQIAYKL